MTIYLLQMLHCYLIFFGATGFDAVFMQGIMILSYKFRSMTGLLGLLDNCSEQEEGVQREILVDIHKMHLDILQ